jgi:serine protease Do
MVAEALARPAPESFSHVVVKLTPAVVNISTNQGLDEGASDGVTIDTPPRGRAPSEETSQVPGAGASQGSGFIIDAEGYIVTNQHVIAGAEAIVATLQNGTQLIAKLVGVDEKTDLALLKVTAGKPLPFVTFGDSDKALVGDWVVVIGNPYGLGGSVSVGIVSARNRELHMGAYDDFIQTDAAINTGNSGGPLFDMNGNVVGVNSALLSPSGGSVGIGFAISSNLAKSVVAQLRKYGETRRGWIGVRVQTVSPEIAESLGLASVKGALIASITRGGPADRAGLKIGDVVVKFAAQEIVDMRALPRLIADAETGRVAQAEIMRKGKPMIVQVAIERLDGGGKQAKLTKAALPKLEPAKSVGLGMSLAHLTPELRSRFGVPSSIEGIMVLSVEPGSTAADNEVRTGDVVVEVSQTPVRSLDEVKARLDAAAKAKKRVVLFGLSRRGDLSFKALKL